MYNFIGSFHVFGSTSGMYFVSNFLIPSWEIFFYPFLFLLITHDSIIQTSYNIENVTYYTEHVLNF